MRVGPGGIPLIQRRGPAAHRLGGRRVVGVGQPRPGQAFERRFETNGSYPHDCRYHPNMTGTVEVCGS